MAGSAAFAFAAHSVVQLFRPGDYWRAFPLVTTSAVYASALFAAVLALLYVAGTRERTRLRVAFWLMFTALGGALCLVAPGGAIYFLLPPLAAALGMAGQRWFVRSEWIGAILAALLLYLTFGPALGLFEELLNGGPFAAFAPLGAAMLLPVLIELRPLVDRLRPAAVVMFAGWIAAALMPAYSADRQQLFTIEYVRDEAARTAQFAVNNDGAPIPYAAAWQRAEMPYTTRRRWAAPAPAVAAPAPTATLVSETPLVVGRLLRLRLAANGAESILFVAPPEARLLVAGVAGSVTHFSPRKPTDKAYVRCVGRACDGAEILLLTSSRQPIALTIVGSRSGLPPAAAALVRARPAFARAQYGPDATIAIGHARF
jgi:hypothetical protein